MGRNDNSLACFGFDPLEVPCRFVVEGEKRVNISVVGSCRGRGHFHRHLSGGFLARCLKLKPPRVVPRARSDFPAVKLQPRRNEYFRRRIVDE